MNLTELRARIDALDAELVRILNERTRVAQDIGKIKHQEGQAIYVPAREKEVLDRVCALNQGPLPAGAIRAVYREIMSASLALERNIKVAYMGPPATFSHQAARGRFGASVEYISCETISDVFEDVEKRVVDYGVVPVENSTEGAVTPTLDCLADTTLKICAEIMLPVSNCFLANGPRDKIKRIYSHPQVLGQCRQWLQHEMAGVDVVPAPSTAKAAEMASREPNAAALASQLAAEVYGLQVIEADVQDSSANITRFVVIAPAFGQPSGEDKTSVLFSVQHKAGALYSALGAFQKFGLNMMRIESRPSRNKAWEYFFFVDVEGHVNDSGVGSALEELAKHCTRMTVLGSYPRMRELPEVIR